MRKNRIVGLFAVLAATAVLAGCAENPYANVERTPVPAYQASTDTGYQAGYKTLRKTLFVRSRAPVNPRLGCYKVDVEYQMTTAYQNSVALQRSTKAKVLGIQSIACSDSTGPII